LNQKTKLVPHQRDQQLNKSPNKHIKPQQNHLRHITAQYQILGGLRKDLDSMRVSLTIRNHNNNLRHRSKPDLFEDKQVEKIAREAGEKLGLRADLIEIDLNELTDKLEVYRENELDPESREEEKPDC
jgi:DNA primase